MLPNVYSMYLVSAFSSHVCLRPACAVCKLQRWNFPHEDVWLWISIGRLLAYLFFSHIERWGNVVSPVYRLSETVIISCLFKSCQTGPFDSLCASLLTAATQAWHEWTSETFLNSVTMREDDWKDVAYIDECWKCNYTNVSGCFKKVCLLVNTHCSIDSYYAFSFWDIWSRALWRWCHGRFPWQDGLIHFFRC